MNHKNFTQQKLLVPFLLTLILLVFVALFIKFPYHVKGPCQFAARQVWSLIEVEPGKVLSRLSGKNPNQVQDFHLLQFDRPDFVNFSLSSFIIPGQYIQQGDLIGTISSTENKIRFDELKGQLEQAKAQLTMISTGEKTAIQEQALQELNYAESAYKLYQPMIERKRQLYKDSLVSLDEWERAETEFKLLALNVSIAAAKLKSVQTGDKAEVTDVLKSEMASIENQIRSLEEKLSAEAIRAPINGIVLDSYQPGTLCSVANIDTMMVEVPIDQKNRYYIEPGMKFEVKIPALANRPHSGEVISVGQNAQMVTTQMMFILTGTIDNSGHKLLPGMTGYVKIYCDKIPLWMMMNRWWHSSRLIR